MIKTMAAYDAAKAALEVEKNMVVQSTYAIANLINDMLQYRRKNSVFEVGDYVIDEQYTGLLKVTRVMKKRLDVVYLNPQVMNHICGSSILIRHVRHATDAEIKAGYKL